MKEVIARFRHVGEPIFNALDENSLQICKNVCKTQKNFIKNPYQKQLCIRFIKNQENNIVVKRYISVNQKWSKLKIQDLAELAKRLRKEKDKEKMELLFLEKIC